MKIVLVVGLPASGKTTYAKQRARQEGLFLVDDPPSGLQILGVLRDHPEGCIIADPHLCCPRLQESASKMIGESFPTAEVSWVFFENDPDACLENMRRRQADGDERQVAEMIRISTRYYFIPEGAAVLPVWRSS